MKFAIASKLSYSAIGNLLRLLQFLCPFSSKLPSSFYQLKKFFKQYTPSHEKKRVCPECEQTLEDGEHCPEDHGGSGHVVHIPIEKAQLSKVSWPFLHNYSWKFLSVFSSSKTGFCWKLCGNSSVTLLANTVKLLWIKVEEYIYPLTSGGKYNWDSALIRMNIIYMKFTEHLELNICNTYDRIY